MAKISETSYARKGLEVQKTRIGLCLNHLLGNTEMQKCFPL